LAGGVDRCAGISVPGSEPPALTQEALEALMRETAVDPMTTYQTHWSPRPSSLRTVGLSEPTESAEFAKEENVTEFVDLPGLSDHC
jgi:hypothetical protein